MRISSSFSSLILVTGLAIVLIGCGSSGDDDDDETELPANRFSGTFVSDIDTGSFAFTVVGTPRNTAVAMRTALSAEINSANLGILSVPGTWSSEFNDLRLESPTGAVPFVQILGSFDGNVLDGFTSGDLGNGVAVAIPDEGNVGTVFCGRFTRSSNPTGGRFNLVITNNVAQAVVLDELDFSSNFYSGSVAGMMINVNDGDGTFAAGVITGTTVSGTWFDDEGDDGNWMGSTAECLTP